MLYLFFKDKTDYCRLCFIMFVGMTLAMLTYLVWPNGLDLREPIQRQNVLCQLVELLRSIDTPTNVCPSIHISSTASIAIVGLRCKQFRGNLPVKALIWTMTVSDHPVHPVFAPAFGDRCGGRCSAESGTDDSRLPDQLGKALPGNCSVCKQCSLKNGTVQHNF